MGLGYKFYKCVEAKDATKHLQYTGKLPEQKVIKPKMSIVLSLRNLIPPRTV